MTAEGVFPLRTGWQLQSSASTGETGAQLSTTSADTTGWYDVEVPCTVLACLVQTGEYPNLLESDNLEKVDKTRFDRPWWYRRAFKLPLVNGQRAWLILKGINYRAEVWLNGRRLADADTVVGTYRDFELEITSALAPAGEDNVLALLVTRAGTYDLDLTFADWAPWPPDQNMGVWQDVVLATSGPVRLRHPFVDTDLDVPSLASARLTLYVDAVNPASVAVAGTLAFTVANNVGVVVASGTQQVSVPPGTGELTVSPTDVPALTLSAPDVWWPWQYGGQPLYTLTATLAIDGATSDVTTTRFGIRKVASRIVDGVQTYGVRAFTINGKDILINGAGYAPDLLQRRRLPEHPRWQEARIRYAREMNLNAIRGEGKFEDDELYDLCDEAGLMVIESWQSGAHSFGVTAWEDWWGWDDAHWSIFDESMRTQVRRARAHPSWIIWVHGSDFMSSPLLPGFYGLAAAHGGSHPEYELRAAGILDELHWPNPSAASAEDHESSAVSGPSGFGMNGPYDYTPPLWYFTNPGYHEEVRLGNANAGYGFSLETGPGGSGVPLESLRTMLAAEPLWPIGPAWRRHESGFHSTTGKFADAVNRRYGEATGVADFVWKAEAQAYELQRAMFEANQARKYTSTYGTVMWLLSAAWPQLDWQLFDYYLRAGGNYFGTKTGCAPLHALFDYGDGSVKLANAYAGAQIGLTVDASRYNLDGTMQDTMSARIDVVADSVTPVFSLPPLASSSTTYFLRLVVRDAANRVVNVNSYWLSTTDNGGDTADLTGLQQLPPVQLTATVGASESDGGESSTVVTVTNLSSAVAMLVRLKLLQGDETGPEVLPAFWDDNYLVLLPSETRTLTVHYFTEDLGGAAPAVAVQSFNNDRLP